MTKKTFTPFLIVASLVLAIFYAGGMVFQPIFGVGDTALWEFMGSYFAENVSLFPFPSINFESNSVFYPYGTSNVFQDWSAERELFSFFFNYTLGLDNALYLYYILSLVITTLGPYFLFRREFGKSRAAIVGLVIAFFNFYALAKFPGHYNMSTVHWTSLSVCIDYFIIYKISGRQRLSLKLILLRGLLLILSVGQPLGYVAGYALLSFVCMIFFAIIFLSIQFASIGRLESLNVKSLKDDFLSNKRVHYILIALTLFFAYLYVSIDLSIYTNIKKFESLKQFAMWASPLRALIPWSPWVNPGNIDPSWLAYFNPENPEGLGANSPGYFLLLSGIVGAIFSKRRSALIFLLLLFVISLTNHPYETFSISHLPWLEFARAGSRISILFAPILGLFLLSFPVDRLKNSIVVKMLALILVCTATMEFYSFNSVHKHWAKPLGEDFKSYMNIVSNTAGEAVFDWPFCVAGGNGLGTDKLGPYYNRNNYIPYLTKYHDKKVVGLYLGRLTNQQIEPYLVAGFHKIFSPDNPDYFVAKRQNRPMTQEEWDFLDNFFTYNDFAGINLYEDLIFPSDVQLFYSRFGQPQTSMNLPRVGKVNFIPKDQNRDANENPTLGKNIVYLPPLTTSASLKNLSPQITAIGFDKGSYENGTIHGVKNGSYLLFRTNETKALELTMLAQTYPNVQVEILLNGQPLPFANENSQLKANANSIQGINRLEIISNSPDYVALIDELLLQVIE